MKRFRLKDKSLYIRLLCLFCAVLLPIQIIGSYSLLRSSKAALRAAVEKAEAEFTSSAEALETQIDVAFQRIYYAAYTNSGSQIKKMVGVLGAQHSPTWWTSTRLLVTELLWMREENELISAICVWYPEMETIVTDTIVEEIPLTDEARAEAIACSTRRGTLLMSDAGLSMQLCYPAIVSAIDDPSVPTFILTAEISTEMLFSTLTHRIADGKSVITLNGQAVPGSTTLPNQISENGSRIIGEDGKAYYCFSAQLADYNLEVAHFVDESLLRIDSQRILRLFMLYNVVFLAALALYAVLSSKYASKPIRLLLASFEKIRLGNFNTEIQYDSSNEFTRLIAGFNEMARSLNLTTKEVIEQQTLLRYSEFKQLQTQIKPHFLYNTFFMLERFITDEDEDAAAAVCRYLGNYFRYITRSGQDQVPLHSDFAHAMNYLQLQKMRYESRLVLDIAPLPQAAQEIEVPRLIFQPIVENMFEHGFSGNTSGMTIRIRFMVNEKSVHVFLENSSASTPYDALTMNLNEPSNEVSGLKNIHRRIRLRFGADYGVSLHPSELGGLLVEISLPNLSENIPTPVY